MGEIIVWAFWLFIWWSLWTLILGRRVDDIECYECDNYPNRDCEHRKQQSKMKRLFESVRSGGDVLEKEISSLPVPEVGE